MSERYRKQILFDGLGETGQERLCRSRVVVIGCGALGSVILELLVRAGVGFVRFVDRDFVELSNLQRQVLYDESDVAHKLPKVIAASQKLAKINSEIILEPIVQDVTYEGILDLIRDVDCILDGTDNFETRFLINDAAVETNTPWIHAGCVGSHGQVMSIVPRQTPCLRCLMPEIPDAGSSETCDTAGVIGPAVNIVASLQVVAALKILSGQQQLIKSELTIVDVWDGTLRNLSMDSLNAGNTCPCCSKGERLWLHGKSGSQTSILCGRNSVQVSPGSRSKLILVDLAKKLADSGIVQQNAFLLTLSPFDSVHELTIFTDGRAIITGTEDPSEARSLYARYIGL